MPYILFTEDQKRRAASVDLPAFLKLQGVELKRSGKEFRLATDPYITLKGNQWYDQGEQQGGNAISFVRRFYGRSYPEAVTMLLEGRGTQPLPSGFAERSQQERKSFALPPRHTDMRRVFAYLIRQRCIPAGIVSHFAHAKMLYESAEPSKDGGKVYHNAIFVGCDENGTPQHAHKRGLNSFGESFRGNVEGSDPDHSFHHIGSSDRLFVFEAPIDLLSFIALHPDHWQCHSYVALCGVAEHAMVRQLYANPHLRQVVLCLDNDERGHAATKQLTSRLAELGYRNTEVLLPIHKDWNEDLKPKAEHHLVVEPGGNETPIASATQMSMAIELQ